MSELISLDDARLERMQKVAELKFQNLSDLTVARRLGMKRVEVIGLWEEYRVLLENDDAMRDRAREALTAMDQHYSILIQKSYDTLDEIQSAVDAEPRSHQLLARKLEAVKTIADLEAKRLDALQKAGMLENSDMGDELARMEEKHEILIGILRQDLCTTCKRNVATKLQQVTQQAEAVVVYPDE